MSQYARPDSDLSAGSWTASSGTDLYACLDESSYSDSDYIRLNNAASTCEIGLSNLSDPGSSSNHIVRVRASKTLPSPTLTLKLIQGSTQIASWTLSLSTSATTFVNTLSSSEADAITDYADLRLQFVGDASGGTGRNVYVYWAEFEVPNADTFVTPGPAAAIGSLAAPTVRRGSLSLAPGASISIASLIAPAAFLGSVVVTAPTASAFAATVAPTLPAGSITVSPAPAASFTGESPPTVRLASLSPTPASAHALGAASAPAVWLGSISATAVPATARSLASLAPPFLSSVSLTPAQADAYARLAGPDALLTSLALTPTHSSAISGLVDPSVVSTCPALTPVASSAAGSIPQTIVIRIERLLMPGLRILPPELKLGARTLLVDAQGNGDYTVIQDAIDAAVSAGADADSPWLIRVAPGVYYEYLDLADHVDLCGLGYSPHATVIKGPNEPPWYIIHVTDTTPLNVTFSNLTFDWSDLSTSPLQLITLDGADHELIFWDCIIGLNPQVIDYEAIQITQGKVYLFNCDAHAKGVNGVVNIDSAGYLYARNSHLYDHADADMGIVVYVAGGEIEIYHSILDASNGSASSTVALYLDGDGCTGKIEFSVLRSPGTYCANKSGSPTAKILSCLANKAAASGVPNANLDVDILA